MLLGERRNNPLPEETISTNAYPTIEGKRGYHNTSPPWRVANADVQRTSAGGYKIHPENSENGGSKMRRFTTHSHTSYNSLQVNSWLKIFSLREADNDKKKRQQRWQKIGISCRRRQWGYRGLARLQNTAIRDGPDCTVQVSRGALDHY